MRRAIDLNPNHAPAHQWYGMYLAFTGRFEEGGDEMKRAQEIDPLSLAINAQAGFPACATSTRYRGWF